MEWLLSFLSGWKAWAAALGLSAVAAAGGGFYAGKHWAGDDLAQYKAQVAQQHADDATKALQKFKDLAANIQTASINYGSTRDQLNAKLDTITKEFRNAIKPSPLPPDCRPDAGRVRALTEAVTLTNSSIAPSALRGFGETVRTAPAPNGG
jgi:hypothetical protein